MGVMNHHVTLRLRHAVAAAILAAPLSACGGSDDTGTTGTSSDVEQELLDYVECLRGEGLDIEDPQVDANGNLVLGPQAAGRQSGGSSDDQPTQAERDAFGDDLEAAQQVCGELPEGIVTSSGRPDDAATQDAMLEFAQCLRDHGLDVEDPDPNSNDPTAAFGDVMDSNDPQVQAATEDCQEVFTDLDPSKGDGS
jgi:hypothetical protein